MFLSETSSLNFTGGPFLVYFRSARSRHCPLGRRPRGTEDSMPEGGLFSLIDFTKLRWTGFHLKKKETTSSVFLLKFR